MEIDNHNEIENLFVLARRAKQNNDSENAKLYYRKILEKQPSNWEAAFYTMYFTAASTTLAQLENSAINVSNNIESIAELIMNLPEDQIQPAISELRDAMLSLYNLYLQGVMQKANGYSNALQVADIALKAVGTMVITTGDVFVKSLKDSDSAKIFYKHIIDFTSMPNSVRETAISRMKSIDSSYTGPNLQSPKSSQSSTSGGCYVATCVYGSYDCPEVWTLRRYRDYSLATTWYGRMFIYLYYAVSPTIVKLFGNTSWFKNMWRGKLDRMVKNLQRDGYESTPYEDKHW